MLKLTDIRKDYKVASDTVHALKGVSLAFRKSEFVCILGHSGCGKTTLLNIIGGLDHYTSGDLVINGVSTKEYGDRDWDTYRNHSVGFIFQSYHLIPHQTILQNVELALTIAGIGKEERKKRAIAALEKVGIADKVNVLPNQLSGGQMQRVAIARALVNDPEIVLADEPTGALDSKTSVQIMELLKEVSKDRLVVMVTHNPELADQYATRIVRLFDGEVVDDSDPYSPEEEAAEREAAAVEEGSAEGAPAEKTGKTFKGKRKAAMGVVTSFMLSLKNLLSKHKRTAMVSVAGSIGIIGVSMVLAVSAGVQNYIASMENDLLSGYPLAITETAVDFSALMDAANAAGVKVDVKRLKDKVYVDSLLETLMNFSGSMTTNTISPEYKSYVESMPSEYYTAMQLDYGFDMSNYIYTDFYEGCVEKDGELVADEAGEEVPVNISVTGIRAKYRSILEQVESYKQYTSLISTVNSFAELPNNYEYILSQYDILATDLEGNRTDLTEAELKEIFESKESLVLVVEDNGFSDLYFGQYGYLTERQFLNFAYRAAKDPSYNKGVIQDIMENGLGFDYFVGENAKTFKWYPNDAVYSRTTFADQFELEGFPGKIPGGTEYVPFKYNPTSENFTEEGLDLNVRVILQKKRGILYGCLTSGMYYTQALADYTRETAKESEIAKYVRGDDNDGKARTLDLLPYNYDFVYYTESGTKPVRGSATYFMLNMSGGMMSMMSGDTSGLTQIGAGQLAGSELPIAFYIYPVDFDNKDLVTAYLDEWNEACSEEGTTFVWKDASGAEHSALLTESERVTYTDTVGLIISMVNTMIRVVTIALIVFTALSLVVSTVMVGIITYVSVVERIKEIGILRAIGARKKDIKRLFIAETFIIGLAAGIVGIGVTYLLSLIVDLIIGGLFGIYTIAALPWWQAIVMVCVSVMLTLISGLMPAQAAAKKDPVIALRTE